MMRSKWPVGNVSSLEVMELLSMNHTPEMSISRWFPGPDDGVSCAMFLVTALTVKANLPESCYVNMVAGSACDLRAERLAGRLLLALSNTYINTCIYDT